MHKVEEHTETESCGERLFNRYIYTPKDNRDSCGQAVVSSSEVYGFLLSLHHSTVMTIANNNVIPLTIT